MKHQSFHTSHRMPAVFATLILAAAGHTGATTIMVNSIADVVANDGQCTLREAINSANGNVASGGMPGECAAGQASPTVDTIAFNIAGSGVHSIAIGNGMPHITQAVTIDGYTQPGTAVNTHTVGDNAILLIEIDASNVSVGDDAPIKLGGSAAAGTTIRGLAFNHLVHTNAILDQGGSNNVKIVGNFIGTDTTGMIADATGAGDGISCVFSSARVIGGAAPADRNVIALGGTQSINFNGCSDSVIQGNYIGVNAAGSGSLGAGSNGIFITQSGSNNRIGGTAPGEGNVIHALAQGINLSEVGNHPTTILGNYVGTDATGLVSLGTTFAIAIDDATGTVIGGSATGAGNVLNGTGAAILIHNAPGTIIQGNFIGTGADGMSPVVNAGVGIRFSSPQSSGGGIVGGVNANEGNTIANSCSGGIFSGNGATNWAMLGNSIHSNGSLGIALQGTGLPFPNDTGDADTGSNNLQNYPVLTSASVSGGIATIAGTFNSVASKTYRLEFFSNIDCSKSGAGEGQTFLGFANIATDPAGNASFGPLTFSGAPANQTAFAATATDPDGNTSEFSMCVGGIGRIFANGFEAACGN